MRCPACGSESCTIIEETKTDTKGYGVCSGICGYILMGPVGLICGLCGMGDGKTTRKAYWVCHTCGHKFRV